jgi:hypothetical protein
MWLCLALLSTLDSAYNVFNVQIEHCLHEWESGVFVPTNLDETVDGPRYRNHLANAITWKNLNKDATTRILEHISCKLLYVSRAETYSIGMSLTRLVGVTVGRNRNQRQQLVQFRRRHLIKRGRCWRTSRNKDSHMILRRRFELAQMLCCPGCSVLLGPS